jgi:addiction module HigA family antidote
MKRAAFDPNLPHPGAHIRALMNERGLSVIHAAKRAGVSRQQLTRLVGEKSGLSPEMALRLQSVFGADARGLLELQLEFDLKEARERLGRNAPAGSPAAPSAKDVVKRLRAHRLEFNRAGVERLYLFGSVARGDAKALSDVDLFYDASPSASIGLVELGKLRTRMESLIGRKVDLVPRDSFRPKVRTRVEREAVPVF